MSKKNKKNNKTENPAVNIANDTSRFKPHFLQYWDMVKDVVDKDGWVYAKEVPFLLDAYFESNTEREIDFENHYEGEWRGYRWRPKSIN